MVPRSPLSSFSAPPFTQPYERLDEMSLVDIPPRPEDVATLNDVDLSDNPNLVREHRRHPAFGYAAGTAMPFAILKIIPLLPALSFAVALVLATVVATPAAELGWRLWIRPRMRWNGAGVAGIGALGRRFHFPWMDVQAIEVDGSNIALRGGTGVIVGPARRLPHWLGFGERTADQLATALRHAKQHAASVASGVAVPHLPMPSRPRTLVGIWVLVIPILAVLVEHRSRL